MNIAIRTALVKNGQIEFWAGGGIVADSDPEREYDECQLKAEKFLKLI
jgi:para-aminobenzoate synthetase component 1